ncbi:MAG: hypothetical protein FWF55_04565 [Treponema sp.]|nr:hypothetical protein [Treponema sp.]
MNAKNGKCGVFAALTAVLLVTVALITSCPAPVEVVTVYRDGYQPPEGMGYLTVNLPEFTGERTVLPSAGDWKSYELIIQQYTALSGGTTTGSTITMPDITALSDPINLAPGFYALTVTAFLDLSQDQAAAKGISSRFTISAGTGTSVSVTLKPLPYDEATDPGTFEYSLNFNALIATAQMTITAIKNGGTSTYATPQDVTEGGPFTISLTPGSYSVFLQATVGGKTASITEIVNIHQNLKSSVIFDFNGSYFVAYIDSINLTYTPDDIKPALTKDIGTPAVTEATTISLSLAAHTPVEIGVTNEIAFTEVKWYAGGTSGTVTGGSFTITAGTAPFTDLIIYPVTVVGLTATGAHSTSFKIQIVN